MSSNMEYKNSWGNPTTAAAYSKLEFPNTYYLAYRDLPKIIGKHIKGTQAVDFGCGAGRSTRYLKQLGFDVIGIDISKDMVENAKELDQNGDYRLVADGKYPNWGVISLIWSNPYLPLTILPEKKIESIF